MSSQIQVSFQISQLPSGNLEITLDTSTFSFGPDGVNKLNGVVILPGGSGSGGLFQEVSITSKEVYVQGNTSGSPSTFTVKAWVIPATASYITGYVTIPSGCSFTPAGPLGESGTMTSSGSWSIQY